MLRDLTISIMLRIFASLFIERKCVYVFMYARAYVCSLLPYFFLSNSNNIFNHLIIESQEKYILETKLHRLLESS